MLRQSEDAYLAISWKVVVFVLLWCSPVKADFIRAKYQFLAFVNKHKDAEVTLEDINKVCWTVELLIIALKLVNY